MELLEHYGMTGRTMHDPIRCERRARGLIVGATRDLAVAHLLIQRAMEVRRGQGTLLRVPTGADLDWLGGLVMVHRREADGPVPPDWVFV